MKIAVLGAGAWGKIIGGFLQTKGHEIHWLHHTDRVWPAAVSFDLVIVALHTQGVRQVLRQLPAPGCPVVSLCKGLEVETGARVSEVIEAVWGSGTPVAVLSGPTLAAEVARGLPTAAVLASKTESLALRAQELFHLPQFRIYSSTDVIGVEWGGALKNVYAIAGGLCRGLELGDNSQAALLTRCLAEMARIGEQVGGRAETFAGLSGVGDLILTAMSPQSRNFRVGLQLAQGQKLPEILAGLGGVAEGVPTARAIFQNALIPISAKPVAVQVYEMLYDQKSPRHALRDLLNRSPKEESA